MDWTIDESTLQILCIYTNASVCYAIFKLIDTQWHPATMYTRNLILRVILTSVSFYFHYSAMPSNAPLNHTSTMMAAVLVCIPMIKCAQLILFDNYQTRNKRTFFTYITHFLWIMFPISKNDNSNSNVNINIDIQNNNNKSKSKSKPKTTNNFSIGKIITTIINLVISNTVPLIFLTLLSMIFGMYFQRYMNKCLFNESIVTEISNNYLYLVYYSTIQVLIVICGIGGQNIIYAIVRLITLDHYKWLEFNNYPLFSISITQLWSKRYNQLIRTLLHQSIFTPAINYGISKQLSAMLAFFVSGLMHVYVAQKTFGHGKIRTLWFFILHGFATVIESFVYKKSKVKNGIRSNSGSLSIGARLNRIIITMTFFIMTLPLYMGLFVEGYPEYGKHSGTQEKSSVDVLNQIVDVLPNVGCYYPNLKTTIP